MSARWWFIRWQGCFSVLVRCSLFVVRCKGRYPASDSTEHLVTTNNEQRTTNNEQRTTNNEQRTTDKNGLATPPSNRDRDCRRGLCGADDVARVARHEGGWVWRGLWLCQQGD